MAFSEGAEQHHTAGGERFRRNFAQANGLDWPRPEEMLEQLVRNSDEEAQWRDQDTECGKGNAWQFFR